MEVLTEENINPAFNRVKYDLRGWLEDRAHGISQELARVSMIFTDHDLDIVYQHVAWKLTAMPLWEFYN